MNTDLDSSDSIIVIEETESLSSYIVVPKETQTAFGDMGSASIHFPGLDLGVSQG